MSNEASPTSLLATYMAQQLQRGGATGSNIVIVGGPTTPGPASASAPAPAPAAPAPAPAPAAPAPAPAPTPAPAAPASAPAASASRTNSANAPASANTSNSTNASANSSDEDAPRYYYTQQKFWGKPTLSYSIYSALAIIPITGFLGLDHMYMRSPGTGLTKILMNVCTLGMWYFYDVIQAVTEKSDIYKFGVSMPLYGPSGIGAGSFIRDEDDEEIEEEEEKESNATVRGNGGQPPAAVASASGVAVGANGAAGAAVGANGAAGAAVGANGPGGAAAGANGAGATTRGGYRQAGGANNNASETSEKDQESPISFMLYSLATFLIPFGFEYLFAGDFKAFAFKFVLTFFLVGAVIGFINIVKLITNPAQVLCEGTRRPLMPFMDMTYDAAYFRKTNEEGCPVQSSGSWFSGLFDNLIKRVPVLGTLYEVGKQTVDGTKKALASSQAVLKQTAEAGAKLAAIGQPQAGVSRQLVGGGQPQTQLGGGSNASNTVLTFVLAVLFIGASVLKGREAITKLANNTEGRPVILGNYLWRKKNVDDLPPAAPEPGIL